MPLLSEDKSIISLLSLIVVSYTFRPDISKSVTMLPNGDKLSIVKYLKVGLGYISNLELLSTKL